MTQPNLFITARASAAKKSVRSVAAKNGCRTYFTGKPCKHGHIALRKTVNGCCVECVKAIDKRFSLTDKYKIIKKRKAKKHYIKHKSDILAAQKKYRLENADKIKDSKINRREKILSASRKRYTENRSAILTKKREYDLKNRDKLKKSSREYRQRNKEKVREWKKKWALINVEKNKAIKKADYEKNKARYFANVKKRNALLEFRLPKWANTRAIEVFYKKCREKTVATGMQYHVDHIVPLRGKTVSGLHVENNLQIIPALENMYKGNRLLDEVVYG